MRVGAVGLGAGAIAAYGRPGDTYQFFEIDPTVVSIARDPASFTFLADSSASIDVEVEDGRLGLESAPDGAYDLLVLDAFSSDAVPVHLLTVGIDRDVDADGGAGRRDRRPYLESLPRPRADRRGGGQGEWVRLDHRHRLPGRGADRPRRPVAMGDRRQVVFRPR